MGSHVLGFLEEEKRGCRQGDPISAYLFFAQKCLQFLLKKTKMLKGLLSVRRNVKYQFADDSELFQNGKSKTFEETIRVLGDFGNKSGLKINIEKKKKMKKRRSKTLVWLGSNINSNIRCMPHLKFEWNPTKFKILGIWFTNDPKRCTRLNIDTKFQEVKSLFIMWSGG